MLPVKQLYCSTGNFERLRVGQKPHIQGVLERSIHVINDGIDINGKIRHYLRPGFCRCALASIVDGIKRIGMLGVNYCFLLVFESLNAPGIVFLRIPDKLERSRFLRLWEDIRYRWSMRPG